MALFFGKKPSSEDILMNKNPEDIAQQQYSSMIAPAGYSTATTISGTSAIKTNHVPSNHYKILGSRWYTSMTGIGIGVVAVQVSDDGKWKAYIGNCHSFSNGPQEDEQIIAADGAKIREWEIAAAMFPNLDSQLFTS